MNAPAASPLRLFLVDDHQIVLEGLRLLVDREPTWAIVGRAFDCDAAWSGIAETKPEIVVMDLDLPGEGGVALTARLARAMPLIKIIVLTGHLDAQSIRVALEAGARGYVLKVDAGSELVSAIHAVRAGGIFLSPKVAALFAEEVRRWGAGSCGPCALSARELDVLRRIADGHSTKEIAFDLNVSAKTVETHRLNIMEKTGARGVAELTKFAVREGLVRL